MAVIAETVTGNGQTTIEDEPSLEEAMHYLYESSADFAGCLIGIRYRRMGCRAMVNFYVKAERLPGYACV